MAEQGDFKHISVTAAEEDEIIWAGAAPGASEEDGDAPAAVPTAPAAAAPRQTGAEPRPAAPARSARDGVYREQTLQDLEPAPMPLAQKLVIIAAVVCIIGALVYYLVVMR